MKTEKLKPRVKWLNSKVGGTPIKVQLPQKLVGLFKRSYQRKSPEVPKEVVQSTSPEVLDPPGNLRGREVESTGFKVGAAPKCWQPTHSLLKFGHGKVRQDSKVTHLQEKSL